MTVNHLTKLHSPKDPVLEAKKFQAGFGQCAAEACRFIMSVPDLDERVSQNLISHLSRLITTQPLTIQVPERFSPPTSPSSVLSDRHHYCSDQERSSSDAEDSVYSENARYTYPKPASKPYPAGLLTTVDKLHSPPRDNSQKNYFNRVPAEAKDVILQKIRQHIMDKRGNDAAIDYEPERYTPKESYRTEYDCQYPHYPSNGDTLDLRKTKSPTPDIVHSPKAPTKRVEPEMPAQVKTSASASPEHESPMDYSNLPPKKKRKLIEYQEHKKQEEAKRQLDAFYASKKEHLHDAPLGEHDLDVNKWRPW